MTIGSLHNIHAYNEAEAALKDADEAVGRAYGDGGNIEAYIEALSARAQTRATVAVAVMLGDVVDRLGSIAEGV